MRILFVDNMVQTFMSHRLPVALAAARAGFEVHVAVPWPQSAGKPVERPTNLKFRHYSLDRPSTQPWREAAAVRDLWRIYFRLRPQLVHHVKIKPVSYGGLVARAAKVPCVVHQITGLGYVFQSGNRILQSLVRRCLKGALGHRNQKTIFQNPDDRRKFIEWGLVNPDDAVLIRGSGVDVSYFEPSAPARGGPLVVLPARMLWAKGIREFVDAAARLRAEGVRARFALVGDTDAGNPETVSRGRLDEWDSQGVVEWWGWQQDMRSVFRKAHVVCLPSNGGEGLPRVLLEAGASGRPIVATDVPGCREAVRNGVNGLLVRPKDAKCLAEGLGQLIRSKDLRERMGARGREIAVTEFSQERVVRETLQLYEELLQRQPARS